MIYDRTWEGYLTNVEALFARLHEAGLVVSLNKSKFVKVHVQYLGCVVDHGCVTPPEAKVEDQAVPPPHPVAVLFRSSLG